MPREQPSYEGLMNAGGGSALLLVQLSAMIPGLIPALALGGVITLVLLLPALVLGLAGALLALPPYAIWRLATRGRRRRRAQEALALRAPPHAPGAPAP